jgi:hypothetical protein
MGKKSNISIKKPKIKTMTVKQAFELAIEQHKFKVGANGHYFAQVGWKSPSTGTVSGPYIVHVNKTTCIEIDRNGNFKDSYGAKAGCYFPWMKAN